MRYVCTKRFKDRAICGNANIPYNAELTADSMYLYYNGSTICTRTSQNAYDYFSINEDGKGLERGKLRDSIISCLAKRDNHRQARWDKLWNDTTAKKLRRKDYDNYWLWSDKFYNAEIDDLKHILSIITEVK